MSSNNNLVEISSVVVWFAWKFTFVHFLRFPSMLVNVLAYWTGVCDKLTVSYYYYPLCKKILVYGFTLFLMSSDTL